MSRLLVADWVSLQLQIESFQANEHEDSHALRRRVLLKPNTRLRERLPCMALCFEFLEHRWVWIPREPQERALLSLAHVMDQSTLYSLT